MKIIPVLMFTLILFANCSLKKEQNAKPNILFIGVDDLRTELGCYDSPIAISPNIDKLSENGVQFNRAYCQQAICGPSRASLMTGIRPESRGITHNYIKFRERIPEATLSEHFGANGYQTAYLGKIFHHGDDDIASWNREPSYDSLHIEMKKRIKGFALPENLEIQKAFRKEMFAKYGQVAKYGLAMGPAFECADVPDNKYIDGFNTDVAISTLHDMVQDKDKPFFLAVGYNKPHLNWVAPKKYWDLYNPDDIEITSDSLSPIDATAMGLHPSFELRTRYGIPKTGAIENEMAVKLKHAYLACVSYVDAQVGRLVQALDDEGVLDNTIIIFWADHGWHLGDKGIWGKATNYEVATRVPLIVSTPDMSNNVKGTKTEALVELVDMYPTLCDLANISAPDHLEGTSFKALLQKPDLDWKKAVFSQFPTPALREWGAFPLRPAMRETYFGVLIEEMEDAIAREQQENWERKLFENEVMGYAMRTKQYRMIVWKDMSHPDCEPLAVELYDHETDPMETMNVANANPELVRVLMKQFNKGWKGNLPRN